MDNPEKEEARLLISSASAPQCGGQRRSRTLSDESFQTHQIRRASTLDQYYITTGKKRDWLSSERKILKLEALYQRKTSILPDAVEELKVTSSVQPETRLLETLEGSREVFHPRLGRTWGIFKLVLPLMAHPKTVANLLYSRRSGRVVGTIVALLFGLLGAYMCYESLKVVTVDVPYTIGQQSIEFQLPKTIKAPTYVYASFSNFYQNAKDFVNSQPPYRGGGFHCGGYDRAKQFCSIRPNFKPPLWGGQRTFCNLPPDEKLSPCGLNALWIAYDEYSLTHVGETTPGRRLQAKSQTLEKNFFPNRMQQELKTNEAKNDKNDLAASMKTSRSIRRIQSASKHRRSHNETTKLEPNVHHAHGNSEEIASITEGFQLLKRLLRLMPALIVEIETPMRSWIASEMVQSQKPSGETATGGSPFMEPLPVASYESISRDPRNLAGALTHTQLLEHMEKRWTVERLRRLAEKLDQPREAFDAEMIFLLRLLDAVDERIEEERFKSIVSALAMEQGSSFEKWRELLLPLLMRCPPRRSIKAHYSGEIPSPHHAPPRQLQGSLGILVPIVSDMTVVLDHYQQRATYLSETETIARHQHDDGATPWLAPDDLRWFLWRRPGAASQFKKLYGRIDQELPAGTYRLNLLVNEFPDIPPITKAVTLSGNLTPFGSSQFVVSGLCFLLSILYSLLWLI